jgi:hypothetical protein
MVIEMYTGTTAYEEEIKQEAIKEGIEMGIEMGIKKGIEMGIEKGKRKALINVAKILVTKEKWSLSKAANFFGLNETEERQLVDEIDAN